MWCLSVGLALGGTAWAELPPILSLSVAARVAEAPRVDGNLTEAAWQGVPRWTTFYKYWNPERLLSPLQTEVQLGYDEWGLYLGARMREKEPGKVKALITWRGDPDLWRDDCAEVYFDSDALGLGYREFVVNALGMTNTRWRLLDSRMVEEGWEPDGWQAAARRDEAGWCFEYGIPWGLLGKRAREGDLWRYCFVRYSWSSGNLQVSSFGGNSGMPERFGWLLFAGPGGAYDAETVAREMAKRVPGDWLLPLGAAWAWKQGDRMSMTSMNEVLGGVRHEVESALAEDRELLAGDPEGRRICEVVAAELMEVPREVHDQRAFEVAAGRLQKLGSQLEDAKYTRLLGALLAGG